MSDGGILKRGATLSARNMRIIDRSRLRGNHGLASAVSSIGVFQGADPSDTGTMKVSYEQWENGVLKKGPIVSGTVLLNPRDVSSDTYTVSVVDASGDIITFVDSGDIKNYTI